MAVKWNHRCRHCSNFKYGICESDWISNTLPASTNNRSLDCSRDCSRGVIELDSTWLDAGWRWTFLRTNWGYARQHPAHRQPTSIWWSVCGPEEKRSQRDCACKTKALHLHQLGKHLLRLPFEYLERAESPETCLRSHIPLVLYRLMALQVSHMSKLPPRFGVKQ